MNRHFCQRLQERYGIECTSKLYAMILDEILYYRATLLKYTDAFTARYIVQLKEYGNIVVVHHRNTNDEATLLTALDDLGEYNFCVYQDEVELIDESLHSCRRKYKESKRRIQPVYRPGW